VLQCVAVCCKCVLQCVAVSSATAIDDTAKWKPKVGVAVYVAVCRSMLQMCVGDV